jgi:hypothetical protein
MVIEGKKIPCLFKVLPRKSGFKLEKEQRRSPSHSHFHIFMKFPHFIVCAYLKRGKSNKRNNRNNDIQQRSDNKNVKEKYNKKICKEMLLITITIFLFLATWKKIVKNYLC